MGKPTLLDRAVRKHAKLITTGHVLAIDPSVGSKDSQPGYSYWIAGELEDSGLIHLGSAATGSIPQRLHRLRTTLEAEWAPDILVVERIVINIKAAKSYHGPAVLKMNQAIGACMSQWGVPTIEVSPMSWKATAKRWGRYEKSDENDAIALGMCVVDKAIEFLGDEG
jgi:hypothetical protein